jgi:hypothetical protein
LPALLISEFRHDTPMNHGGDWKSLKHKSSLQIIGDDEKVTYTSIHMVQRGGNTSINRAGNTEEKFFFDFLFSQVLRQFSRFHRTSHAYSLKNHAFH